MKEQDSEYLDRNYGDKVPWKRKDRFALFQKILIHVSSGCQIAGHVKRLSAGLIQSIS